MISSFLLPAVLALGATATPASPNTNAVSQPLPATNDPIAISQQSADAGAEVCLKLRMYIFERNDGAAPKLVRETTCSTARPQLQRSKMPKAKLIPAN
jgi:hypothetical protein